MVTNIAPDIKLLLQLKKEWLQVEAYEIGVSTSGTKLELAARIAKKAQKKESISWDAISNSSKKQSA